MLRDGAADVLRQAGERLLGDRREDGALAARRARRWSGVVAVAAVVAGAVPPSDSAMAPPAAASARAEALSAPRTAWLTAEPGLLEVVAFGSLAGTGVVAAGAAATGAVSSVFGLRKSM